MSQLMLRCWPRIHVADEMNKWRECQRAGLTVTPVETDCILLSTQLIGRGLYLTRR